MACRDTTRGVLPGSAGLLQARRSAFTLIDVMVSVVIVSVLITVMLPGLAGAREAARKVACGSNLRQLGLATHLYADDNNGFLPPTVAVATPPASAASTASLLTTLVMRYGADAPAAEVSARHGWDGWGVLLGSNYLSAREVAYCPSHRSSATLERYLRGFGNDPASVIGNYEFRGEGPRAQRRLSAIDAHVALGSDAFGELGWINHEDGLNTLVAGLAVTWQKKPMDQVLLAFAQNGGASTTRAQEQREVIQTIWNRLDDRDTDLDPASTSPGTPSNSAVPPRR